MYGTIGGSTPSGVRGLHKEAVAVLAVISAVVLVAAGWASSSQNRAVGMMQVVEGRLPLATLEQLANHHGIWAKGHDLHPVHMVHNYREHHSAWNKKRSTTNPAASQAHMKVANAEKLAQNKQEQFLHKEKKAVGDKLAKDMRKLFADKTEDAKERDLKQVEVMKGRYEALLDAMIKAPVLKQLPQVNGDELHVMDPRTGKVYALYEYHVPGGYEDAELDFHPLLAKDLKGLAPFAEPAGRNPTYQGEYPEYKAVPAGQTLYEYHVPGGYEDAELDFHPLLAKDLKGLAPFAEPAGRNPTYQGEYPEYRVASPQMLEERWEASPWLVYDQPGATPFKDPNGRNYVYEGAAPEYPEYEPMETVVVVEDHELKLLSLPEVRAMMQAKLAKARAAEESEWAAHAAQVEARKGAVQEPKTAAAAPNQAPQAAAKAVPKGQKVHKALKAMTQELAEKFPTSNSRVWGAVYEPKPVSLATNSDDPNPLFGESKKIFNHWSSLATDLNSVYDPAKDHSLQNNFGAQHGSWWSANKGDDAWWNHNHAGRGY